MHALMLTWSNIEMPTRVLDCAGGLIQLLAGMWEMWKANTFAATAFSSYGGFWMGWALYGILKSVRAHCVLPSSPLAPGRPLVAACALKFPAVFGLSSLEHRICRPSHPDPEGAHIPASTSLSSTSLLLHWKGGKHTCSAQHGEPALCATLRACRARMLTPT